MTSNRSYRSLFVRLEISAILLFLIVTTTPSATARLTTTISLGSGAGTPGGAVNLGVSLEAPQEVAPVIVQWTMDYPPADVTAVNVTSSATLISAGKDISCSHTTGRSICILFGANNNRAPNGVVATATFTISTSTLSGSSAVQVSAVSAILSSSTTTPASGAGSVITITRPAVTTLNSLSCTPGTIKTPGSSSCTVVLSANAPPGG